MRPLDFCFHGDLRRLQGRLRFREVFQVERDAGRFGFASPERLDRCLGVYDPNARPTPSTDGLLELADGQRLPGQAISNEVEVTGKTSGWLGFLSSGDVRVHARVPERFDIDLHTSGGHIDVQELEGDVRAQTSGGQIDVQQVSQHRSQSSDVLY